MPALTPLSSGISAEWAKLRLTNAISLNGNATGTPAEVKQAALETASSPSTIVSLSPAATSSPIAAIASLASPARQAPIWLSPNSSDPISTLIASNASRHGLSARLASLGSAALTNFPTQGSHYSQAVIYSSDFQPIAASTSAQAAALAQLHEAPSDKISFSLTTRTGARVSITLVNQQNGLGVDIDTSQALSETEKAAITHLASGFEQAIQGLATQPPRVELDALMKYDDQVISDMRLEAKLNTGTADALSVQFTASATQRQLDLNGAIGSFSVALDFSQPSLIGNQARRTQAINQTLTQIDAAAQRGNADHDLLVLFKQSFVAMQNSYPPSLAAAAEKPAPFTANSNQLADYEQTLLSGLADFQANVTGITNAPNPLRTNEIDHFSYAFSQSSQFSTGADRALKQTQHTQLSASFHKPLRPSATGLQLTTDLNSQNYYYTSINDQATGEVSVSYSNYKLAHALYKQAVSKDEMTQTFERGKLLQEQDRPEKHEYQRDLLDTLKAFTTRKSQTDPIERKRQLDELHQQVQLPA